MKKILLTTVLLIFIALALASCGKMFSQEDSNAPYIGENGNWWVGETDTGVQAQGPKGDKGEQGEPGPTAPIGEKGDKGEQGESGIGISCTVINEYGELVITYTDGTSINLGKVVGEGGMNPTYCDEHAFTSLELYDKYNNEYVIEACVLCGWAQIECAHSNYTVTYNDAACYVNGYYCYECNICNYIWIVEDENAPALDHIKPAFDHYNVSEAWTLEENVSGLCNCEWEPVYVATCLRDGCGFEVHETGIAPGHIYGNPEPALVSPSIGNDFDQTAIGISKCIICCHDLCIDVFFVSGNSMEEHGCNMNTTKEDCIILEGSDRYYFVDLCPTCGKWVVLYFENK